MTARKSTTSSSINCKVQLGLSMPRGSSSPASPTRTPLGACCPCCAAAARAPLEINYKCNAKAVKFVVSSIIFMLKATKALQ